MKLTQVSNGINASAKNEILPAANNCSCESKLRHFLRRFQELFICFWVFSVIGHYLEIVWAYFVYLLFGGSLWQPSTPTIIPLAPPYGLGALAVILLVWPLIKRYKLHPVIVFILSAIITGFVEYLCALVLVLATGHNIYWNYTTQPFNINGYTCLKAGLIFGVASVFFLYYIYPFFQKIINKLSKKQLNITFWVLLISYVVDLSRSIFFIH